MTGRWQAVLAVLVVLAGSGAGGAQGLLRVALAFEGEHVLAADEGHVVVAGGRVHLPVDARVAGVAVVTSGTFELDGTVAGDVIHLGGALAIGPGARLQGRLVAAGDALSIAPSAIVTGGVVRDLEAATALVRPPPTFGQRLARLTAQVVLLALVAFALARWAPRPLDRTAQALAGHPAVALALGALSALVGLVLLVAMAFTVVLIPVALLGGVAYALAIGYGWLAWGRVIGRLFLRRGWLPKGASSAFSTAVGTAMFVVAQAVVPAVPWLGGAVALLASVAALGAGLLTGFGWRRFVPDGGASAKAPAAP